MIGYIVDKSSKMKVASIKAVLPYGMVIAKGKSVYTIVLDLNLCKSEKSAIKACAKVVYSSHGWTKKTHELTLSEESR